MCDSCSVAVPLPAPPFASLPVCGRGAAQLRPLRPCLGPLLLSPTASVILLAYHCPLL